MSYTPTIKQALKEFNSALYLVIEVKIVSSDKLFEHRATPIDIIVADGTRTRISFITFISGNRKELVGCFTIDAFTGFSGLVTIQFSHRGDDTVQLDNVNFNIIQLPPELAAVPHADATNNWLQSLS